MYTLSMYRKGINIIEGYFGYQKWTFIPKKRKITYLLWFLNFWPRPPTWHETFKPIRLLVTIFISYTSRYIHNLYIHKVWRKLKDTFVPPHPIKLALARSGRPFGPLKAERWTPKGECRKGQIFPQNTTWNYFCTQNSKKPYPHKDFDFHWCNSPTWHQILKPIRMSVTIFISYVCRYIYIYIIYIPTKYEENWRTLLIPHQPVKNF